MILKILQELELLRDEHGKGKNYYGDYLIRLCEGIVAKYGGFESRSTWMDELERLSK